MLLAGIGHVDGQGFPLGFLGVLKPNLRPSKLIANKALTSNPKPNPKSNPNPDCTLNPTP